MFATSLRQRNTRSCGCLRDEAARENVKKAWGKGTGNTSHGLSKTPEWAVWCDMRKRCTKWKHPYFARYGGRGITVCERWGTFENFFTDLGPRPSTKHTLDRIDNDGNYEPGNVRWSTRREQARNRSSSRMVTAFGKTQPLAVWAKERTLKSSTIRMRLTRGLSAEEALAQRVRHRNTS